MKKIFHIADIDSIDSPGGIEKVIKNCILYSKNIDHIFIKKNKIIHKNVFGKSLPHQRKLLDLVKTNKISNIHLHGSTPFVWRSIKILKKVKINIFLTPFFHEPKSTNRPFLAFVNYIFLYISIFSKVNVHFCTHYERNLFKKIDKKRVSIFPPFFETDSSNERLLNYKEKKYILFVGRDDFHKGFNQFLEVSKRFPKEEFIAVTKPRKSYPFRDNLNVESQISNKKLKKIYSKTKILIFPSAYESFGGVFLEALSYDIIVIASDKVLGLEYFQNNKNIYTYNYKKLTKTNVKQIEKKLSFILDNNISFLNRKSDNQKNTISLNEHINNYNSFYDLI